MRTLGTCDEIGALYDLLVIGAGPAGMSAATRASKSGATVLLADENPGLGGQIYRGITSTPVQNRDLLGESYWKGAGIAEAFTASSSDYIARCTVWSVERAGKEGQDSFIANLTSKGRTVTVEAKQVILATGALERPFAVPGWTLPGVMTAGAAQIAMKSSGLVPAGPTVVAGSGPLLYLVATQLKAAGANIVAILETGALRDIARGLRHLPEFLTSPYFGYGLRLLMKAQRDFSIMRGVSDLRIEGEDRASAVRFSIKGRERSIKCDTVLLHHGVIPNINMANALGCAQHWSQEQQAWLPTVDENFQSTIPGLAIAGDGSAIAGADSAAVKGAIAAVAALDRLGMRSGDTNVEDARLRRDLARYSRGRAFLDYIYSPSRDYVVPRHDDTIVCRCEEVTAGQIRQTIRELDVRGPNQLKAYLRCGMGPCQGRLCGPTVTAVMADARGESPETIGHYRNRIPVKPITVGELAQSPQSESAIKAVVRG